MNIQEELRISKYMPVVGFKGTEIGDLFEVAVKKVRDPSHEVCFLMSIAYNFGLVAGKREERAKKKNKKIEDKQLAPELEALMKLCTNLKPEALLLLKKIAVNLQE